MFNNEEVVNKFKFVCDKFFFGILGFIWWYLIIVFLFNIVRLKECIRFRFVSFVSFVGC